MATKGDEAPLRDLLRLPVGEPVDLTAGATPGGPDDKAAGLAATAGMGKELAGLQERLWASATAGDRRRILLVLQGMDTSGKGGTVKHVIGLFNPAGCRIHAFKAPTCEERQHDFLRRVAKALPRPGETGISLRISPGCRWHWALGDAGAALEAGRSLHADLLPHRGMEEPGALPR